MTAAEPVDVFLSYAHGHEEANDLVRALLPSLDAIGVRAWDDSRIMAGENWQDAIGKALREAHAFVVVVTSASATSPRVNFEIGVAAGRCSEVPIPIIPVLTGDAHNENIPSLIRDRFSLDARRMAIDEIAERIKEALLASVAVAAA